MKDIKQLTLDEAERQLKMNLSLIELLKGNTDLEAIARFREIWVEPIEELIRVLKAGGRESDIPQGRLMSAAQ